MKKIFVVLIIMLSMLSTGCIKKELSAQDAFEIMEDNGCFWTENQNVTIGTKLGSKESWEIDGEAGSSIYLEKNKDGNWAIQAYGCLGKCEINSIGIFSQSTDPMCLGVGH